MATVNKDFRVKNNISLTNTADTITAATHYFVETGSDGVIRPKTLANTRTEIVTTAAVNAAAATTVGTITSGTWNATAIAAANGGTGQTSYAVGDILYASASNALSKLAGVATGNALISGGVTTAPSWGKIGLTTHISGILPLANGGTNANLTAANGGVIYSTASAMAVTPAGSAGQALVSAGAAAPVWTTLTMENIPGATLKRSVKAATTGSNITLAGGAPSTLDGVTLAANDRVLVKDQTAPAQNGIYIVQTLGTGANGTWVRSADADAIDEIASAAVAVDAGTTNGGLRFDNDTKTTDTLGTTAIYWYAQLDTNSSIDASKITSGTLPGDRGVTAGSASSSFVEYNGTTATAGQFDGGTTTPTGTTRLNYGGYFYPTFINLSGSGDTATAATHYFVETGSDGFVRPKTIANVRTEIVTTAAVNAAAATTVGTVTSGTWQGSVISATYIDSAIARLNGPSFTGGVTITGASLADATRELRIAGVSGYIDFHNALGAGNYNGIVAANDKAILFTDGTAETGALVIAPWSAGTGGLRIDGTGRVTFGNTIFTSASTTTRAGINLPHGTAPTAPTNGDIWTTTAGVYARVNGSTVGPFGSASQEVYYQTTAPSSPTTGTIWVDSDETVSTLNSNDFATKTYTQQTFDDRYMITSFLFAGM